MSDDTCVAARFHVVAEAHPGLLPRLLEPFAKRDLTPALVHGRREGEMLRVEIALEAVDPAVVPLLAGNLGQVIGTAEVRVALPAGMRLAA